MANWKKLNKKIDEVLKKLDTVSPEELEKYFPKDTRPHGWISIEDSLPACFVDDFIKQGYSIFKVKDKDGKEYESAVCDHDTWYYEAKKAGVTHWWHE